MASIIEHKTPSKTPDILFHNSQIISLPTALTAAPTLTPTLALPHQRDSFATSVNKPLLSLLSPLLLALTATSTSTTKNPNKNHQEPQQEPPRTFRQPDDSAPVPSLPLPSPLLHSPDRRLNPSNPRHLHRRHPPASRRHHRRRRPSAGSTVSDQEASDGSGFGGDVEFGVESVRGVYGEVREIVGDDGAALQSCVP
ncbi:hypothetical protein PanWU01x14_097850 [Parasponia andersonii]|uniref:Uncharacterized protein n=1 Tax=Parasponia andersonii TaxID=3476 RepID=A0A2P5D4P4_PARAD|nr:hypothetical protein PanWU01x14_097850 [Parasponia andersonii]